jgi:hypothetical protein
VSHEPGADELRMKAILCASTAWDAPETPATVVEPAPARRRGSAEHTIPVHAKNTDELVALL